MWNMLTDQAKWDRAEPKGRSKGVSAKVSLSVRGLNRLPANQTQVRNGEAMIVFIARE